MEATQDPQPASPAAGMNAALGELVIQNGRLSGTARALLTPITVLGKAPGSDLRLNVDGVDPYHCVLVFGPAGPLIRDLQSQAGTQVNGEPVSACELRDGDTLTVGPFHFVLRLATKESSSTSDPLEQEREALRIQAAAVAAQQAALTEQELRMQQRRLALEQQEQQLSAYLEEKRQQLVQFRDETREAHQTLQKERAAYEERVGKVLIDLVQGRKDVAESQRQNQVERQRLLDLRKRLKRRWHRHWAHERTALDHRERDLNEKLHALEKDAQRLEEQKATVNQARLRFNGEVELGRRQLQADQAELGRNQAELQERARALDVRQTALENAEHRLAEEQRRWEAKRQGLQKEIEGLESRVANYRRKIQDQEQEVVRLENLIHDVPKRGAPATAVASFALANEGQRDPHEAGWIDLQRQSPALPTDPGLQERLVSLEKLAGELADQRLYLTDQCERLAQAQRRWQQDRDAASRDLEVLGLRLREREEALQLREQALESSEYELRQRADELSRLRNRLEGWQAQLTSEAAAWEGERGRLLADLQAREAVMECQRSALADLRERWDRRRRRQVKYVLNQRSLCDELRRNVATMRDECLRRTNHLNQERRAVAEQSLAVEQYRQECIGTSANPASTEKHLEQLRRRWAGMLTAAKDALVGEHQAVHAEARRLEELARQVKQDQDQVITQDAELSRRMAAWEEEHAQQEVERTRQEREASSLRSQREHYEQQLETLRDEVERLARLLMDEPELVPLHVGQAA